MKVLFVHNYFHVKSGSGAVMFMEANALKALGHEVFFFATDKKPYVEPDYAPSRFFPKYDDFKKGSKLALPGKLLKAVYNREAKEKLKALISEVRPDIVHLHTFFYHLTPSVVDACHEMGVPTVMTIHGAGFVCPNEKLMIRNERYCSGELCTKGDFWHAVKNRCVGNSLIKSFQAFLFMSSYQLSKKVAKISRFLVPSHAMADMLSRSFVPKAKLTVLENSLAHTLPPTLAAPKPTDSQFIGSEPYFLYAGRIAPEKGIDILLDALAKCPDPPRLYLVGEGPAEKSLKAKTLSLGLANHVKFLGWQSGDELKCLYEGCVATIVPSNWFEAFGLVVIESFSYGKPVIASAMGGIPELISDGQNGLLVPAGDCEALAKAIIVLRENPGLASKMGQNAYNVAVSRFQISNHTRQLLTIYESVAC